MSMKRPGRRTSHVRVSLSPSKIPYVGFSPVRLQTRSQTRSSSIDLYASQVTASKSCSPVGHDDGLHRSDVSSRGPWLGRGLCCPAASSLTMASSEPLAASCRLMVSSAGLCTKAGRERVPNLLCASVLIVPSLVPRRTERLHLDVSSPLAWAFAISAEARHPHVRAFRFQRGSCNGATFQVRFRYGPMNC
jgi:hypothetical protein